MPLTQRLRAAATVASSGAMGWAALPMPLTGIGLVKVAISPLTVLPVWLSAPGAARATQLPTFVH